MIAVYILLAVSILVGITSIIVCLKTKSSSKIDDKDKNDIIESYNRNLGLLSQSLGDIQKMGNSATVDAVERFKNTLTEGQLALEKRVMELIKQLDERMENMRRSQEEKLEAIRISNEKNIKSLQEDNNRQLDKMRETVDEKLSKTINERFEQSFDVLKKQLESVHISLGEMQSIKTDVGSLTRMLSNVKTTGIFGEIQLGAIFDQMLTKDQYETNFVTGEGREPVEYAVKLPGQVDGEYVYMPVDSKFPYTIYSDLQNAYEANDFELVKQKKDQLKNTIRSMAKDISTKYIYPPKTTNFAVMFLPVEGLYAEVAKQGLTLELQQKFNITIAGPTTMSALLNSLQMGFKTLAIQKKSGEVWKILGAVRTEFDRFNGIVDKIQKQFDSTSKEFDNLVGTRSRMIASKLKAVEKLDVKESQDLLGTGDIDEE